MIQIAVLTQGFVYVGDVQPVDDGLLTIKNAYNIRVWGTTRGLGELALSGPTKATILDIAGTVRVPYPNSVAHFIDCEIKQWRKLFN